MKQNYINHIAFVLDASGSMENLISSVKKVFNSQIKFLARRSQETDQETRISVYKFSDNVECLIFDKDVLRLPDISSDYFADSMTALIEGTNKAINDLSQTCQLYGDHSFTIYVLSDGLNNINNHLATLLKKNIEKLPDNWTIAAFAPDQVSVAEYKKIGFPANNICVWDVNAKGIEEVGKKVEAASEWVFTNRSQGFRGSKNIFELSLNVNKDVVREKLKELSPKNYELLIVRKDEVIKGFYESWTKNPYRIGSGYYELTKRETIQANKQICIQDISNGKIYSGQEARDLIGLPNHEIKVQPGDHKNYRIFVQSNSVNRKLINGTQLLVLN